MTTHRGSCLCGRVRYEIRGTLGTVVNCHCAMCRKAHGAAFRTRAAVRRAEFVFLSGEDALTFYTSSPGEHRSFCRTCGAVIITRFDAAPDVYGFALGTLDTDPGVRPSAHIFVDSKAPWFEITDALPRYPERMKSPVDPSGD